MGVERSYAMNIKPGTYTTVNSSLKMVVHKVNHISDKGYIKLRGSLFSKTGRLIETKNYKLELKAITRWVRVNE